MAPRDHTPITLPRSAWLRSLVGCSAAFALVGCHNWALLLPPADAAKADVADAAVAPIDAAPERDVSTPPLDVAIPLDTITSLPPDVLTSPPDAGRDVVVVSDSAACGAQDAACCVDAACNGGLWCFAGTCQPCGLVGLSCCGPRGNAGICGPGGMCHANRCASCGRPGEACCDAPNECADGRACGTGRTCPGA